LVIPGREAKRSEPGIHNRRCLLSTAKRPQLRATSTFVVTDFRARAKKEARPGMTAEIQRGGHLPA
ncbi:MAG: hypothetical protein ACRD9W_16960, partial [Terriglobia bacterium]